MDLSIIIVNWNTRDLLRACLASLLRDGEGIEILVVDNASSDDSARMVRDEFPGVTLIANETNAGYAAGNNQGLAAATGRWLLLLNPDTEVPRGGLGALVAFLEVHPLAGAVSPRLVHPDGRTQESVRAFPSPRVLWGEVTGLDPDAYRVPVAEVTEPIAVDQPMASCFMMRREAFEDVGPIDEDFPIFFNDVDLCYRLRQAGWEIWYLPDVHVLHHGGAATRQVRPEMIRESHRSLERFYAKHYRRDLPAPLYLAVVLLIRAAGACRYWLARRARPRPA